VKQPASVTKTNFRGCDSDGTAASLSEAEFIGALDRPLRRRSGYWTVRDVAYRHTVIRLLDGTRAYVHAVIDNLSRIDSNLHRRPSRMDDENARAKLLNVPADGSPSFTATLTFTAPSNGFASPPPCSPVRPAGSLRLDSHSFQTETHHVIVFFSTAHRVTVPS
jgi:hypothetical protein